MSSRRSEPRRSIARRLGTEATALALTCACTTAREAPLATNEPELTHGFVLLEQHQNTLGDPEPDASLLFGVLKVPVTVSPSRMLRLMGMGSDIPERSTCEILDRATQPSPALSSYERVELVDVGDVSLAAPKSAKLARQAFPTVTDFISGVLYTTRNRSADIGRASQLTLKARGSNAIPAFEVDISALEPPKQLTIDGSPLVEVSRISTVGRVELRWSPGQANDFIWVELETDAGPKSLQCAFDDASGAGSIAIDLLGESGSGRLTLHRIHRQQLAIPHLDAAELYIDVRLAHPLVIY